MSEASIVWFRQDLRLEDNLALLAATRGGGPVIPLFVWAPEEEGDWPPGGATKWWLHQSLERLDQSLRQRGSRLLVRRGPTLETLRAVLRESGAAAVLWNRRYEPAAIARDKAVKEALTADGLEVRSFNSALLWEPWTIQTQAGGPYKVYSPFWRACQAEAPPAEPVSAPAAIAAPRRWPGSLELAALALEPTIDWAGGIDDAWRPGEAGAAALLERFLDDAVEGYEERRNRPDLAATSRLSPHLHFGEISPRTVWHAVRARMDVEKATRKSFVSNARKYLSEVAWREFAHHLLYHFPATAAEPLRPGFAAFPWADDPEGLRHWQQGRTGYPIVDAGMRELWTTGWLHHRVRMIVASFLVKDLLLPWQEGARWFWTRWWTPTRQQHARLAVGGRLGADAAPYFRLQSGDAGREVRPARRVRATLGSGDRGDSRSLATQTLGGADEGTGSLRRETWNAIPPTHRQPRRGSRARLGRLGGAQVPALAFAEHDKQVPRGVAMPFKKPDFVRGSVEDGLQFLPFPREGSQLGDPATQGSVEFLLPIADRQPEGFEHLVVDLLGDGPKRHYVAERGVYRGPESLGIGWRFGGKPAQLVEGELAAGPQQTTPALEPGLQADRIDGALGPQ